MSRRIAFINSAIAVLLICLGIIFGCLMCGFNVFEEDKQTVNNLVTTQSLQPMDTQTNVSEFLSSPFLLPFSPVLAGTHNSVDNISFSNMQFKFFSDGTVFNFSYKIAGSYLHVDGESINNAYSFDDVSWSTFIASNDDVWHDYVLKSWTGYPLFNTYDFLVTYKCSPGFVSNVSYVVISQNDNVFGEGLSGIDLIFVDINSNDFRIQILGPSGVYKNSYFDYIPSRTIYFVSNLTNNDYYNAGYDAGYTVGNNNGIQSGYNNGYTSGYDDGVIDGYNDGVNSTNTYTFSNLLIAVVEAPVNVIISLLDFNIMGYNLLSIVVGLLSLGVIVVIIKLCLGGK